MWEIYALLSALFLSISDVIRKKATKKAHVYSITVALRIFALPVLFVLFYLYGMPEIKPAFYLASLLYVLLDIISTYWYTEALLVEDISKAIPHLALTPLVLLIIGPIILSESYDMFGIIGVALITLGAYLIHIENHGFIEPIIDMFKSKGSKEMLGVALIYAFMGILTKIGIESSSVAFWVFSQIAISSVVMTLIWTSIKKDLLKDISQNINLLITLGTTAGFSIFLIALALKTGPTSFAIGVRRLSILFSVVTGGLVFHEKHLKQRVIGTLLMVMGVLAITFL